MPGYYCYPKVMGNAGENASFGAFPTKSQKNL